MKLSEAKEGDKVILWLDGWGSWDDQESLILDISGILILVESPPGSGKKNRFVKEQKCKRV